jgi:hypothetical protein
MSPAITGARFFFLALILRQCPLANHPLGDASRLTATLLIKAAALLSTVPFFHPEPLLICSSTLFFSVSFLLKPPISFTPPFILPPTLFFAPIYLGSRSRTIAK